MKSAARLSGPSAAVPPTRETAALEALQEDVHAQVHPSPLNCRTGKDHLGSFEDIPAENGTGPGQIKPR